MSECEHNNHDHSLIWLCLVGLMFGWSCTDCDGRGAKMKDLEHRIQMLEHPDAGVAQDS